MSGVSNKIEVTKVKSKDCVVASRDSDFCVYYESVNPLFYEVWVCEHCGYAALQERFENISPIEAKIVKENISSIGNLEASVEKEMLTKP